MPALHWQRDAALCTVLVATLILVASAQSQCDFSCKGMTIDGTPFDLSALMGVDYSTTGTDSTSDTYYLNVCGTSSTQCPDDAGDPPVTTGTAVQTVDGGGCYVLGTYEGENCLWTSDPDGREGVQLEMNDGSNDLCAEGVSRHVTMDFICPQDTGPSGKLVPATWTAKNEPGSCQYTYTFETCAACRGGCMPPPPGPTPAHSPSAGPDGPVTPTIPGGPDAFGWVCIVLFGMFLPAYLIGGFAYNYHKGSRGLAALPPPLNRFAGPPQRGPQDWTQPSTAYGGVDAGVDSL